MARARATFCVIAGKRLCELAGKPGYGWFETKVKQESQRNEFGDEEQKEGRRRPPPQMSLELAAHLIRARERPTHRSRPLHSLRPVRGGCAEAHEGMPRFTEPTPNCVSGTGRWPGLRGLCQCPLPDRLPGRRITFLENEAVQIHRTRCIGCDECAKSCPLRCSMATRLSPSDALKEKVANKCDLCLTDQHDPPCVACCPYDACAPCRFAQRLPWVQRPSSHDGHQLPLTESSATMQAPRLERGSRSRLHRGALSPLSYDRRLGGWSGWHPTPGRAVETSRSGVSRLSGYAAAVCMFCTYLYLLRRLYRGHRGWPAWFWRISMSNWLNFHIGCAYLGFAFLCLHCWGRARTPLTFWLLGSVWLGSLSGVVGYYGQRFLYQIFPAAPIRSGAGTTRGRTQSAGQAGRTCDQPRRQTRRCPTRG